MQLSSLLSGLRARTLGACLSMALFAATLLLASGCGSKSASPATSGVPNADVAATVNGEQISQKELDAELNKMFGSQVLQNLIAYKLVMQAAKREKLQVAESEVKTQLEDLKKNPEAVAMAKNQGLTDEDLEKRARNALYLRQLVLLEIPERDKLQMFDNYKEQLEQAHVFLILLPSDKKDDAVKIEGLLKKGQDFESLARQFSKHEDSKGRGGDLGWVPRAARIDPTFMKVVFSIPVNQVSDPIKTKDGWSIIKVVGRKKSYDEVKSSIEDLLVARQQREYLQRLQVKADIKSKFDATMGKTSPSGAPGAVAVPSPAATAK